MIEQDKTQIKSENNAGSLPVLLPALSQVLRRAETSLRLMQEVVNESSVDYWVGISWDAMRDNDWDKCIFSAAKAVKCTDFEANYQTYIREIIVGEFISFVNRSRQRALQGDTEGSLADDKEAAERSSFCKGLCNPNNYFSSDNDNDDN